MMPRDRTLRSRCYPRRKHSGWNIRGSSTWWHSS